MENNKIGVMLNFETVLYNTKPFHDQRSIFLMLPMHFITNTAHSF